MKKFLLITFLFLFMVFIAGCKCGNRSANAHESDCPTCKTTPTKASLDACTTCNLDDGHTGRHTCGHGHSW